MSCVRFGVLGPLAVWTDEGVAVTVPGAKVRALLADLLVHRGTMVSADQLIADLWERDAPAKPTGALQAKVSQLRRALESAEPGGRDLVMSRGPGYVLDVAPDAVDAARFTGIVERTVADRPGTPDEAATRLADALALWRGPALADVADAAFARAAVVELEEQWLTATEAHLDARSALGEDDAVITELTTLAARHPLRERLHGTLMRALYRGGRQGEALRRYEELRATLADELGADPSPELAALHGAILRQEPELDRPSGSPAPVAPVPSTLPATWDETIGREDEIADLRRALGVSRLVTVVGPGGVGKTRLALEAARTMRDEAPDGVWFVDLSGVDGPSDSDATGDGERVREAVADAVAETLGLRDDSPAAAGSSRPAQVVDTLRDRQLVLVLDNCEHLLDAAADLVADLLRRAPGARVLATSREPLGLRGEHLRSLATLALPDDEDPAASPAVRLFVARAAGADPSFALTATTTPAVVAVCRRLDGLPLALELAAARVRTLGLGEVAARLDDRFALLDSGPRDAPPRQRTLRAVMDWSWEPLSAVERAVLRRLAATADGAGADLVAAVCEGDPVPAGGALTLVARLVDRSLVTTIEGEGGTRWRMLETVAAYAGERLEESGEAEAARRRHAAGVATLVERAAPHLRGHEQALWLARLDQEGANVRVALDTAVAAGDGPLALRLVVAAHWYWYLRGRRSTARRSLARALEIADGPSLARADAAAAHAEILIRDRTVDDPVAVSRAALAGYEGLDAPHALAHAQRAHAHAVGGAVDLEFCEELMDAALRTFRAVGDRWGVATLLSEQGINDVRRGRLDAARAAADEAGELVEQFGDRWVQTRAATLLGLLDEIAGDYAAATRRHREGLRHAEELRLWPSVILHHNQLGRLALLTGDPDRADTHHDRALALARDHGHTPDATFARLGLGMAARRRGRWDDAEKYLQAAHAAHAPAEPGTTVTYAELGFVAEQRGDVDEARRRHQDGLAVARRTGDVRAVALALEGLAGVAAAAGEHEEAAVLLGAADAGRASAGAPLPAGERGDVDRIRAVVEPALGADAFAVAFERGRAAGP